MWIPWLSPLKEINKVLQRLLSGDLSARVTHSTADRFGKLGENLNQLAQRFESKFQMLTQDRARLLTVLINMVEAVVAVDIQGRVLVANPAFSKLFGVEGEIVGRPLLEVLRHTGLNQILQQVLKTQEEAVDEITTWDPEERVFEAHGMPLVEGTVCVGALFVLHDITRIRKLEKIRKDFVANVSHELRTPLASIKGFAETLREGGIDDEKNRLGFVKSIENHADRMTDLVDDLLDLTAIESGQRAPTKEPLDLTEMVDEVIDSLKQLAARKNVTLMSEVKNIAPVPFDKKQIKQVLTNLLQNAIKFNKEKGTVTIRAKDETDTLIVSVTDTGIGIPPSDLPRIFERFYRVDKARSREMGGTGLGLAIVKHIIEAHGGRLTVESTQGEGSTFQFTLPKNG